MSKRKYEQVQDLLPEIKAMVAEGKTKRKIAEYLGLANKYMVKSLLIRERRKWRQMRQQFHKYENLLNREFQTDRPNHKYLILPYPRIPF